MKYFLFALCFIYSIYAQAQKAPVNAKTAIEQEHANAVCSAPDQKAYFEYGQDSLDHFVAQHVHFRNAGDETTGKAVVVFIVEKDGTVGNAEIIHTSGNKAFDDEAVRVVKTIPSWKPAMDKGKVVRSTAMLTVVYRVE